MASSEFSVPLRRMRAHGRVVFRVQLILDIRTAQYSFTSLPFLFDTGTQLSMISIAEAQRSSIPFTTARPVSVTGVTGKGLVPAYLSFLWLSFPALPQWQFETLACFTPYPLKRSLLSLSDVHSNFLFRTGPRRPGFPDGSLIFRLRRRHQGQVRP